MNILPNNLGDFPPGKRLGDGERSSPRRVGAVLGVLLVLGTLAGLGAYRWVISQDDMPPPPPSLATSPVDEPPPDIIATPAPDPGQGPGLVVTGLLGNQPVSQNWAGYAATEGGYTSVSGTWAVPDIGLSSAAGTDAAWVGIGGVRSRDLIQAGTLRTVLANGATQQEAWVELLPGPPETVPLAISPGDTIHLSIDQQGPETWLVSFANVTSGQNYVVTKRYASSLSSAEWVEEAPSSGRRRTLPLDNFGIVRFTQASATRDMQTVNLAQSGAHAITMITPNGQHLAEPSRIGNDGDSFSVSRTTVPSPAPRGR